MGSRYKVYTQPIALSVDPASEPVHWVLCGLVRPDRFTSQTWSLSYFWIISLASLISIAVLCLPVVRLAGRQAGMLRSDTPMIAAAAFLLPAFATIFGAYLYHRFTYQSITDGELKRLAGQVDQHFTEETRHIIAQLDYLTERLRSQTDRYADEPAVLSHAALESKRLFTAEDSSYTNFDLVFWTDDSGGQQVKWARGRDVTPFLSLERDAPFRHLRYDRNALLDGDPKWHQDSAREFTFEPTTSQTTGESIAGFGLRLQNPIEDAAGVKLTAAFMVCKPESLFHAVLPPGFGFAIVDDSGNVLFSHHPQLNLEENLFQETDNDKTMQSAMNSVGEPFDASYKGREHRIYLTPLQQIHRFPRLALAVYKDGIYDETLAAEIAGMAATLYGYYVLSILLVVGAVRLFFWSRVRARFADRIWPAEELRPEYAAVFLSLIPLATVFFLSLFLVPFLLHIVLLPLEALLLPAWAVIRSARILSGGRTSRFVWITRMREGLAQRPLAQVATLACAALILNVSVLPAAAFFRVAHLHETVNFLLVGQRKLADAVEHRYDEPRTRKQLRDVGDSIRNRQLSPWDEDSKDYRSYLYHKDYFASVLEVGKNEPEPPPRAGVLQDVQKFLYSITAGIVDSAHAKFNRIAMEEPMNWTGLRADPYLRWRRPEAPHSLDVEIHKHAFGNDPGQMLVIQSQWPPLVDWRSWLVMPLLLCAILAAAGAVLLFVSLRWLLTRVFQIGLRLPEASTIDAIPAAVSRHTLFLLSAWQTSDGLEAIAGAEILDVPELAAAPTVTPARSFVFSARVVAIRNFDFRLGDPTTDLVRLNLLESLVYSGSSIVAVATSVDPLVYFSPGASPNTAARWQAVLAFFDRQYFRPPAAAATPEPVIDRALHHAEQDRLRRIFARECAAGPELQAIGQSMASSGACYSTDDQIVTEMGDRARAVYARLWSACSSGERLALYRLAYHRFLNLSDREAILELRRKGLVVFDSGGRCFNESFRRYVLAAADLGLAKIEDRQSSRGWNKLSTVLVSALAGIALIVLVAVFLGQKDTVESGLGYVTAAATAVTTVTRILSARTGSAASGLHNA